VTYFTVTERHLQCIDKRNGRTYLCVIQFDYFFKSFVSVNFAALLFNMNTNCFFLFSSAVEEVKVAAEASLTLALDRAK
jgi:hypothetical protein